ncbi:hypothetical protein NDN08_003685 [Rhodosorus marinus]|uniref:Plastid lipid-associated protein/fibrillin conserved domain-containing protein n=1 Tax=Rhodosorus marinus TaxID=101924 RepID=A0AAV8UX95_9RHOD|nr:hypothetical protein NDN08_003685 [Rhodosorus marinus]
MQLCAVASDHEGLLLSMVAGTDRGRILDEKQRSSVENVISLMERENEMEMAFPQNLSMLDGRWRLIYTTRSTPSATVFGAVRGVYQVFDTSNRTVENRIEFSLLPNMPRSPARTSVAITSKFETIDNSRLRLKISNLSIQLGNLEPRMLVSIPPELAPFKYLTDGSDDVDITYVADTGVRVLRSMRGELRVFVKDF